MPRVTKQETMTAAEYALEMQKPKEISESLKTARLFAFQCKGRRLPEPRWKENGGEVRFAKDEVGIVRQGARKKTDRAPQWAFDFCWPDYRIACEVEGIIVYRDKASGQMVTRGGHTTPDGFNDDCEKYAWAAVLGWRLVRFTPKQVKAGFAIDMLVRLFHAVGAPLGPTRVENPQWTAEEIADMTRDRGATLAPYKFNTVPKFGRIDKPLPETTELQFAPEVPER